MSDRIEDLLAEFVQRRESGELLTVDAFLAEHAGDAADPTLLDALQTVLATEDLLPSPEHALPSKVGPYRVLGLVSRGGMGQVLRVEHEERPGTVLALKLVFETVMTQPRALARWKREGEVLRQLRHPGIVRFHDVGVAGSTPYLVMELLEGKSLAEVVADAQAQPADGPPAARLALPGGGSSYARIARLAAAIARAVAALHEKDLLHRDLKPANVVLDAAGQPVLVDFGLAGGEMLARMTRTGDVLGTPAYMAPEQARGEHAGPPTDLWGIGAILFELLTLEPPHTETEAVRLLDAVRSRPVRDVRTVDRGVPGALARIAGKALSFHPSWRYRSAVELAGDLDAFADAKPVRAGAKPVLQRAAETWQFRRRLVLGGAGAVIVAAALAFMLPWLARGRREALRDTLDRGTVAWLDGEASRLAKAASEAVSLDATHPISQVLVGLQRGDAPTPEDENAAALLEASRRIEDDRRAKEIVPELQRLARLWPDEPLPVAMLGLAATRARDNDLALRELTAAVRLLPNSIRLRRSLARLHRLADRVEEAEQEARAAIALDEDNVLSLLELVRTLYKTKRFDEGLAISEHALALEDPPSQEVLNAHASLLDQLGRHDDADVIFRRILAKYPEDTQVLRNLGYSLDSNHRLEEARDVYKKVLAVDPHHIEALMSLAWLHSGSRSDDCADCKALFEKKPELFDAKEAERYLLQAMRISKGRSSRLLETAVVIAKRADCRDALRAVLQELAADPENSDRRLGRLTRAIGWLKEW